ncbi:MAG: hypothetical protein HY706_14410 [Candidatus Hydrogenedentes bacterium]|nr:hypothetical protein [Candidatus Hydrogenedentota bacterium]
MRIQTFLGKLSVEALRQMDEHINHWLEGHGVEPKMVSQVFGYEHHHHEGGTAEPVVVTSVWY